MFNLIYLFPHKKYQYLLEIFFLQIKEDCLHKSFLLSNYLNKSEKEYVMIHFLKICFILRILHFELSYHVMKLKY